MTKPKLTPEEKAKFEKLRKEIADREHKDAWRNVILGKIKLLELTLKYDWAEITTDGAPVSFSTT